MHASRAPSVILPQLAGEGGRRSRPDGVWPTASMPGGLHERWSEHFIVASLLSTPHPSGYARHLPRFAEKGAQPPEFAAKTSSAHISDSCGYADVCIC